MIRKTILSLIVIWSLVMLSACPSQSTLKRAANASYTLSGATLDVVRAVDAAYSQQLISKATKDALATKLILLTSGGQKFNDVVKGLAQQYNSGVIPQSDLGQALDLFKGSVVTPFLDILASLKIISNVNLWSTAIETIRAAVIIIADAFGANDIKQQVVRAN